MKNDSTDSPPKALLSDSQIIDRFGGIRPMAAKLGIAVTTVQGWKARGHIPENRRQAILEAAKTAGIDMGDGGATASVQSAPPTVATGAQPAKASTTSGRGTTTAADARRSALSSKPLEPKEKEPPKAVSDDKAPVKTASGSPPAGPTPPKSARVVAAIAWIALGLSILMIAGLVTRPYWESTIHGPVAADLSDIERTLDGLTAEAQTKFDDFAGRIAALEAGGGEAGAALATQLETLEQTLSGIEQTLGSLDEGMRNVDSRLAELEAARGEIPESVSAALRQAADDIAAASKALVALRADTEAHDERLTALETRPVQTGERIAALALAIGQAEAALNDGRPYRAALDRLVEIAPDDQLILDGVSALYDRSTDGIPARPALQRRFAELAADMGRALNDTGGDSWIDRTWHSLSTVITVRRKDGPDASPVSRAEAALADGDLAGVIDALGRAGSLGAAGDAWLEDVRARVEAENEIEALYGQVIAQLAATGDPSQ